MDIIPSTDYKIIQSDEHFKYGIDSILLSSFAKMNQGKTLVDIGCGVGILALRCHYLYGLSKVYAFEIQEDLARLASESVRANSLEGQVCIINRDVREGFDTKVDYIITNPPYIEQGRGLANLNSSKHLAFHELTLNLDDIFLFGKNTLKDRGRLFMVNRANRLVDVMERARSYRLEPTRLQMVHSFTDSKAHLFLVEFVKNAGKNFIIDKPVIIYNEDGSLTKEVEKNYER